MKSVSIPCGFRLGAACRVDSLGAGHAVHVRDTARGSHPVPGGVTRVFVRFFYAQCGLTPLSNLIHRHSKRSPDLNPLDYGFWAEVNRRLRRQELKFAADKKESRQEVLARLRRTAKRVPEGVCAKLISSMKRRVADLQTADGGDFEE